MFTLNPGGGGGKGGKGRESPLQQNLWFFGQLGLYFLVLRGAFHFMAGSEERKALGISTF